MWEVHRVRPHPFFGGVQNPASVPTLQPSRLKATSLENRNCLQLGSRGEIQQPMEQKHGSDLFLDLALATSMES